LRRQKPSHQTGGSPTVAAIVAQCPSQYHPLTESWHVPPARLTATGVIGTMGWNDDDVDVLEREANVDEVVCLCRGDSLALLVCWISWLDGLLEML
jgi:hypothetical protein